MRRLRVQRAEKRVKLTLWCAQEIILDIGTKEHIIFEYYSKIMTALVSILFSPNDIEKKPDDRLGIVEYTQEYVRDDDNLGENITEVEEIPQDTPPSGPKF